MMEPLFGTAAPPWPGAPSPVFGFGTRQLPNPPLAFGVPQVSPLGVQQFVQPALVAPPHVLPPEMTMAFNVPALLAAVAMRRGQPMGPTTDPEIEDFVYDALDLVPGTTDVEVRVESGRVTLTGSVPHKRLKHDAGEIAWAIPSVTDVQNTVTIAARRRARNERREAEGQGPGQQPMPPKPKDR